MQKVDKNREKFLESVKNNLKEPNMNKIAYLLERSVKKHDKKMLYYENIISIGTKKPVERVDTAKLKTLLRDVYKYWYDVTLENKLKENSDNKDLVKRITDFKNNDYYKPSKDMPIVSIWEEIDDRSYWFNLTSPIYFQGRYFCQFHINQMFKDIKNTIPFIDARIYLNIKPKNMIKLCDILVKKSLKEKLPLMFKIAYDNKRNDNFVLYSSYEFLPKFVQLIRQTKREYPELFEDCKVKNPFMATLFGYMGFGEEPFHYGSYNSTRSDLLLECQNVLSKQYAKNPDSLTKQNILNTVSNISKKYKVDSKNFCLNIPREELFEMQEVE